jgi:hypothetical protein
MNKSILTIYHLGFILLEVLGAYTLTESPPMEGIDGILYKFAKTGKTTTLVCEAMSVGSADICTFTRYELPPQKK